jgi:DNA processing protein
MTAAACPDCLRRAWLLSSLAPYIERAASASPGRRCAELLALPSEDLAAAAAPKDRDRMLEKAKSIPERDLRRALDRAGCWSICPHCDGFPSGLRDAGDRPWALVGTGRREVLVGLEPEDAVAIVGARRASGYGRDVARSLGRDLAAAGLIVVSGLAYGVDGAAHRGAVETGRALAVLGSGADVAYPAAHRGLHRRIQAAGAIVSELPPGATPWRWSFPARNRIMAALARMTVVVEAAPGSGSLITVGLAEDLGRDVGAVPGPITSSLSAATNELLASGACMVRGAQDVLDAMLGAGAAAAARTGPALEPDLAEALEAFERGDGTCDALAAELDAPGATAALALVRLERLGYLQADALGAYSRTVLRPPD